MTDTTHDRQRRVACITDHARDTGVDRIAPGMVDYLVRHMAGSDADVTTAIAHMDIVRRDLDGRRAIRETADDLGVAADITAAVIAVAYADRPSPAAVAALLARIAGRAGVSHVH